MGWYLMAGEGLARCWPRAMMRRSGNTDWSISDGGLVARVLWRRVRNTVPLPPNRGLRRRDGQCAPPLSRVLVSCRWRAKTEEISRRSVFLSVKRCFRGQGGDGSAKQVGWDRSKTKARAGAARVNQVRRLCRGSRRGRGRDVASQPRREKVRRLRLGCKPFRLCHASRVPGYGSRASTRRGDEKSASGRRGSAHHSWADVTM